jgi:predicted metal-dependent hydrolase
VRQLVLPFQGARPIAGAPRPFYVNGRVQLVRFVRVKRARRYLLRIHADGTLRVTLPPGGSVSEAEAFVRKQAGWVAREQARLLRAAAQAPDPARTAELRRQADAELPARLRELAAQHGFALTGVRVRDQRTRWGSCSRRGGISLNWRLIQMPAHVRDYILLHELAHLRHLNHSRQFWKLVASICPWYREAHRWLKDADGATVLP